MRYATCFLQFLHEGESLKVSLYICMSIILSVQENLLCLCMKRARTSMVMRLLCAGCMHDNHEHQDGNTALIYAAANRRSHCVRLLLDAGADKKAKNHVRTACHYSADIDGCVFDFDCLCDVESNDSNPRTETLH